ncbi:MAG: M14 family metallopeptidase [Herpetosiphon sp.]
MLLPGLIAVLPSHATPTHAQAAPLIAHFVLGASTQGRPITGVRIGQGARKLALIGDTHGGPEANTYRLVTELATYIESHPDIVPDGMRLDIIPTINPDGLALGTRQNANGVDLNRNMATKLPACPENDWRHSVQGAYGVVVPTGGPYPESEAESRIVRDFLLDADGVIFYHSNAGVVFPACDHKPSQLLARIYADSAAYAFIPRWDRYVITGGMHDWAGGLGIAAVTPELVSGEDAEVAQNIAGLRAVLKQGPMLLPMPGSHTEGGLPVQPIIWRAWRAWGGQSFFGLPLEAPIPSAGGWSQLFEGARFEYHPDRSESTAVVQLAALGSELYGPAAPAESPVPQARFFAQTGHNLPPLWSDYWQRNGALPIFGLPLTETTVVGQGPAIQRQLFERSLIERQANGHFTRLPLGRYLWARRDLRAPMSRFQAR